MREAPRRLADEATNEAQATTSALDELTIRGNVPGSFAWGVLHQRHPALVTRVRDALPYPPSHRRALDRLLEEISTGTVEPLRDDTHDHDKWEAWGFGCYGQRWADVPFLWAESYFYRRLLDAVGFFDPGPWRNIDPFEPFKRAELSDPSLQAELALLDEVAALPTDERAATLVRASLWGNRADLGFRVSARFEIPRTDHAADLVADDSALMWSILDASAGGRVCLAADNAGRELLPDLILIDHLLKTGRANQVALHVKPYPYYVSDATTADVIAGLRRLMAAPGRAGESGNRLWHAMRTGRLAVGAHAYYCAPLPYHHMPQDLIDEYASAALTIMKGDLNYRRLVGDCAWPATTPFADLTRYFPSAVAALRTLKSDVVVGVEGDALSALDATGEPWRTNGTHALIQGRR